MTSQTVALAVVVSREEWLVARKELLVKDESRGAVEYNYRHATTSSGPLNGYQGDLPARSVFLHDGDAVFHAYSAYTRGLDQLATHYNYLDLTPYGRQEAWEDSPPGWPHGPVPG